MDIFAFNIFKNEPTLNVYKVVDILIISHTDTNAYFSEKIGPEIKAKFSSYFVTRMHNDPETLIYSKNRRFGHEKGLSSSP